MRRLPRRTILASVPLLAGCTTLGQPSTETRPRDCTQSTEATTWTSFQSDPQNSGSTTHQLATPPEPNWALDVGDRDGGIVTTTDTVYLGAGTAASYTQAGRKNWTVNTGTPVEHTPAFSCQTALYPTLDAVIAVKPDTGTQRWTNQLGAIHSPILPGNQTYTVCASKTVYHGSLHDGSINWSFSESDLTQRGICRTDKTIYAVAGDNETGTAYAINSTTGETQWTTDLNGKPLCQPVTANNKLITITSAGTIIALNANTGTKLWSQPAPNTRAPTPAIANDTIYVASGNTDHFVARTLEDGTKRWTAETGPTLAPPVASPNTVLVGTMNRGLIAYSPTGDERWQRLGNGVGSPLCVTPDSLLFIDARNTTLQSYTW
ncbi:hypothetical protein BRD03_14340 [Halobacteriales archaeon QS_9_68_17]|nr:MAG: hypothetical protein BRD03_14340 [Halobacteriales archaeon QS_9_68_17]